jgi:phenylpropionate dioxygenase-like ring-hydroxylating dioxygenase large terminal subunit
MVGVYRGFVFASLAEDVPSFDEYLGADARACIDMFCDLSPVGEIEASVGTQKMAYRGNWKLIGMDGYHAPVVHRSIQDVLAVEDGSAVKSSGKKKMNLAAQSSTSSGNTSHDFGHGHVRMNFGPSRTVDSEAFVAPYRETAWGREYLAALEQRLGTEHAHDLIAIGAPHVGIWPNLQLIEGHIRVVRPISASKTVLEMSPALLKGVPPEVNARRLREHEFSFGPCSFIEPDDFEIFERTQVGLRAILDREILLTRGTNREQHDPEGTITGSLTDEVPQRGQLREWKHVMTSRQ